jgi:hypothetical protein
VRVFELTEPELGAGLRAVAGHDLGEGPVLAVGDQNAPAEDLVDQFPAGVGFDVPTQGMLGCGVTGQFPADDAPDPGVAADNRDLGLDLFAGADAGQRGGQVVEARAGFGQRLVETADRSVGRVTEWVSATRRSTP